jgi:hypothetical protein
VGEEIKKQVVGKVVSGFVAKNIQICIFGDKKVV